MKIHLTKIRADVESETSPGKVYVVEMNEDGIWFCSCPAYHHGGGSICKHIREVDGHLKK